MFNRVIGTFKMKPFLFFLLFPIAVCAQTKKELVSVRVGYSSTDIAFKEAPDPSFLYFGLTLDNNKTFRGHGLEIGVSKSFNSHLYIDLCYSNFSGKDTKAQYNDNVNWYTLKGFQIPLTINYLLRNPTKRLRINLGGGLQYLKGELYQYETVSDGGEQTTNQKAVINISELQFSARPGLQFRIIPDLFATFTVNLSISTSGRLSDRPCLSLMYSFHRKN